MSDKDGGNGGTTPEDVLRRSTETLRKTVNNVIDSLPGGRDPRWGDEPFVVCHWDTFDNEIFRVGGAQTLEEAEALVQERYAGRIRPDGADQVVVKVLQVHQVILPEIAFARRAAQACGAPGDARVHEAYVARPGCGEERVGSAGVIEQPADLVARHAAVSGAACIAVLHGREAQQQVVIAHVLGREGNVGGSGIIQQVVAISRLVAANLRRDFSADNRIFWVMGNVDLAATALPTMVSPLFRFSC